MTSASSSLRVYRSLLKAVDKHLTSVAGNQQWRDFVREDFRKNAKVTDAFAASQQLRLAEDYCALINNIALHKELLLSYNIGLEEDERTKQMVEAVARRVGFSLPKPK
uniref:Uncharacterized protein n=1 Tax=Chlamydomonas leiostraca TaxID=1034604 RepID=A0A7S0REN1_9CHLO|mmetsp:Transcript_209/g.487  ORF Transcript_209/g.487 Transcript_209/m.487 type:complete len:108 (+) Transcript_209:96-419(+)|eukprot:CAMPEP_0202858812 /NCGR_PEP_ID=MMETSP1391-20130828/1184_1 /ASSEMBLY_ACC=CAM_ASM_000867 /TAXON_ID=1034604 /ORGANISM="Chlamydomonas leiostraca, Strain SAG 11-49" /LENGTH=107 /DNA_ID=CAMNT_0049537773 /DNA_START=93 /DNA_END=416 /DNA_ORIENTATION=+